MVNKQRPDDTLLADEPDTEGHRLSVTDEEDDTEGHRLS